MSTTYYNSEDLENVLANLNDASVKIRMANDEVNSAYQGLHYQIRSGIAKRKVTTITQEIENGTDFYNKMEDTNQTLNDLDVFFSSLLIGDDTLSTYDFTQPEDIENYDYSKEIQMLKNRTNEELIAKFQGYGLSEKEMQQVEQCVKEDNMQALAMFMFICENKNNIKILEGERDQLTSELYQRKLEFDTYDSDLRMYQQEVFSYFEDNNYIEGDAPEPITKEIFDKEVTFSSYDEAIDYFNDLVDNSERKQMESQFYAINNMILEMQRNIDYEYNEIDFQLNYSYAYDMGAVEEPTLAEIKDFAISQNIDLKTCEIADALTLVARYYSQSENHDKPFNWISYLDMLKETNENLKTKTMDDVVATIKESASLFQDFCSLEQSSSRQNIVNDLISIIEYDYQFMSDEDKLAYSYFLYKEGFDKANDFLKVMENREYNAIHGALKGYEKFQKIVEQKGELLECIKAYVTGGVEGLYSFFDNTRSFLTGDYTMTVNDYEMQTIQSLLQTIMYSYNDVTAEDLDNYEANGLISTSQKENLISKLETMNGSLKYYDILVETGDMTTDEASQCAYFMQEIAGGEKYVKYFLSNAYSAGISSGNMVVPMLISAIPGVGGSTVFQSFGRLAMFISSAGSTYRELRQSGYSGLESYFVGSIMGGMEVTTEKFLGGLSGLSNNAPVITKGMEISIKDILKAWLVTAPLSEMREETIQLFGGDMLQCILTGQPYDLGDEIEQLPATLISTYFSTFGTNAISYAPPLAIKIGGKIYNFAVSELLRRINPDGSINTGFNFLDKMGTRTLKNAQGVRNADGSINVQGVIDHFIKTLNQEAYRFSDSHFKALSNLLQEMRNNEAILEVFRVSMEKARNQYHDFFSGFREHGILHTALVTQYALSKAQKVSGVNFDVIKYSAMSHDFGMKGGYYIITDKSGNIVDVRLIDDIDPDTPSKPGSPISMRSDKARGSHPLNSALAVLTTDIVPASIRDVVALIAMTHSKSTSGISNMNSQGQWLKCIDTLETVFKKYQADHPEANVQFDADKLRTMVRDPSSFKQLVDEATLVRDGDAMSKRAMDAKGDTVMHTGTSSRTSIDESIAAYGPDYDYSTHTLAIEEEAIIDELTEADGAKSSDEVSTFSKTIHEGEANVDFDSEYDGVNYHADAVVVDPYRSPISTWRQGIAERLGEVATYTQCETREFLIHLPAEVQSNPSLVALYEQELEKTIADAKAKNKTFIADFIEGNIGRDASGHYTNTGNIRFVFD